MADQSPTPPKRQPLLADAPPAPPAPPPRPKRKAAPVGVTGGQTLPQTSSGSSWGPAFTLFIIQLVLLGGVALWGASFLKKKEAETAAATPATPGDTASLQHAMDRANAQIAALQRQLDAQGEDRSKTQGRLQEMADRMALVIQQSSYTPTPDGSPRVADSSQMPAMLPSVTPATGELILIKERNRLTTYADKAIATGSRESLQAIVDAMMDPAMKHLAHAAQAEFKRVQAYYDMGIGIDPGYTLPVRELFKDTPVTREADLTPLQLQTLLQDQKLPWEARLRAAFLLRSSTEAETNALLIKALKEDPILDVAKQAQITFEKRVGRRFRLFDIPAIEAWWQAQGGGNPPVKMIEPGK